MDTGQVVDIIYALPQARQVNTDEAYWSDTVPKLVPLVIDEIVGAHDFDFTLAEYSSLTTVADQATYTVYGADRDCRDIISIRLGSDKELLTKYRTLDMDEILDNDQAPDSVAAWDQFARENSYPVVRLVGTPGTTGDALHIRYRRNNMTIQEFPDEFGYVIALGVLGWLMPTKRIAFERQLKKIIKNYRRGGKDTQIVSINPHMVQTHNTIADLYETG